MEAGKTDISKIFTNNRVVEIPFFQRSYVWDKDNWDRFLDDMQLVSDENRDYFLGSIILKQLPTSQNTKIGDRRLVIDGQQRLTTLVLFFHQLCDAQNCTKDFERQFINRADDITLKHNHNDISDFENIVYDRISALEKTDSNIYKCYEYFNSKQEVLKKLDFDVLLNKIYFVGIDLGAEEDEQQIFDTINSLGVSLTTAELLKNELFKRQEDEKLYNDTWKKTFEGDNRNYWEQQVTSGRHKRENIDLLLQSYLLLISGAKEKYARTDSLFKNYKAYIKDKNVHNNENERVQFIKDLVEYAKIYRENINPHFTQEGIDGKSPIARLNIIIFGLNTTTIIPYIVYILKEVSDLNERKQMFGLLESYIMRRMICKETTKNYNNMFLSLIRNKINNLQSLKSELYDSDNQTDLYPDNQNLKFGFENSNLTNQQAKTTLYLIETAIRNDEKESTSIRGLDYYSLEHIMPKKWRNHWDNGLDEHTARDRDQKLLKLGNLTLITSALNTSIRDASWKDKQHGKKNDGLSQHSKNIKTFDTAEFLGSNFWDEGKIKERSDVLYDYAQNVWKY